MIAPTHLDERLAAEWRRVGAWTDELVSQLLDQQDPMATAIIEGSRRVSFGALTSAAKRLAVRFANDGIRAGDVISMQLPNWWEAVVVSHAAFRIGAVLNPLLPALRARDLDFIFAEARPTAVVVPGTFRSTDHLDRIASLDSAPGLIYGVRTSKSAIRSLDGDLAGGPVGGPSVVAPTWTADDPCLLLYTSGTSSAPKGVLHTHNTLLAETRGLAQAHLMSDADVVLLPMPVTHIGGMVYGVLMPAVVGLRCVFLDVWDPARAIELLADEAVTVQIGMPVFLRGLLDDPSFHPGAGKAMRLFSMGGTRVTPADVDEAAKQLGCWCKRSYGLTEVPTLTTGPATDEDHRACTDGLPIGPSRVRVVDPEGTPVPADSAGEILCQAPELFVGYLTAELNAEAFTADGWFRTGDVGILCSHGFLSVTGRIKDIIIRGGENISPKEVEDLLIQHPDVQEAAVVAMPDRVYGERACAFVQSDATLTLEDLTSFLRAHGVASYKLPERLERRSDLPRNTTGKLRKDLLRAEIAAMLEHEAGPSA